MTDKTFILIAWRNVRRNGRRSFLAILIASIGLTTLIISNSLYDGFHEKMIENAVRIYMGHIQIHGKGFHQNPAADNCFEPSEEHLFNGIKTIRASARRVKFQAMASTAASSQAVIAIGIEPEKEKEVSILEGSVLTGSYLGTSEEEISECLVGEYLFNNLRMETGEKLVLVSQAIDGALAVNAFRVAGVCRTGNPDIDRSFVWIPLSSAQEMLGYGNSVSEIVLLLNRASDVEYTQKKIKQRVDTEKIEVLNWQEIAPDIVQLIALDIAMQRILMTVIAVIVAVAIMNVMMMSIQERFTEFGIMSAIGTRPGQIVGMVLWESFFLGILGVTGGLILSSAGLVFFYLHGVNLASFSAGVTKFIGLDTRVFPILKSQQVMISSFIVLASSTVISVFPALKAAHMDTVKAIRHI